MQIEETRDRMMAVVVELNLFLAHQSDAKRCHKRLGGCGG
jgi:hypothetical protein